ncbi:hypothetical protein BKI52_29875 [marine bacterium AO1-C]|nr:hypothetical protein BKI52_29875 [marine bacterium AO1-C]
MNKFYNLPIFLQWTISVMLLAIGMFLFTVTMSAFHPYGMFLLFPVVLPLAHFALTPLLTLLGMYKYYSPLLLVYSPNAMKYDIHMGTSFDYLFVMHWRERGLKARKKIWSNFLQGLIQIMEEIEAGKLPDTVKVEGTSYFFSVKTAQRLGFVLEKPSLSYRFNLIINYVDLWWMYSFAQNRLAFPRVFNARKAIISGKDLVKRKHQFEQLVARLQRDN